MIQDNFLVLENDIKSQGLPADVEDFLDINRGLKYEVWWWFKGDVNQYPAEAVKRFAMLKPNTFIITSPSFIGWDNSFELFLDFFEGLAKMDIKLSIGVFYRPNFDLFLIKWINARPYGSKAKKNREVAQLKRVLAYHDIYTLNHHNYNDLPFTEDRQLITWKGLVKYDFREIKFVEYKGKKYEYSSLNISNTLEESCVTWEKDGRWSSDNKLPLLEIKKLRK